MIKQLLNSVIAKCRDLSAARRAIDLLATDKSRYFAQTRPIIDKCAHKINAERYINEESEDTSKSCNKYFTNGDTPHCQKWK